MNTQQFGLDNSVFDGSIAQHDDLFLGPRQQRVAVNLKVGLTSRDSVVTLTGSLGAGKTTLAAHALSITATRLAQSWVGNMPLTPDEMLELLLAGFELAPYDMGRVQRLHTWRQFVSEMSATDTRICILVEDALELGTEGLQALEALTAPEPNDCPGANLILMGSAELPQLLEEPRLARLKQRVRSRQRLDAMTAQEVEQYLQHRLTAASGDYETIFAPGTAAMVHSYSAGIPRMINNVCETALIVAATRKAKQLTPEIVQRVAEGVYGLSPSAPAPEAPAARATRAATAVKAPAPKPVPLAKPASVEAIPPAPAAAPVATVKQPAEKSASAAKPAPVDAVVPVDPKDAEALEILAMIEADDSAELAPEPPLLTDEIDIDLQDDAEDVAKNAQPAAATLPPDAPTLPDEALKADKDFSEDFAAATHLHEISDEMAEWLFSADPAASATGVYKAATPLDSNDLDLSAEGTGLMRQLDEDAVSESDENEGGQQRAVARTLVF